MKPEELCDIVGDMLVSDTNGIAFINDDDRVGFDAPTVVCRVSRHQPPVVTVDLYEGDHTRIPYGTILFSGGEKLSVFANWDRIGDVMKVAERLAPLVKLNNVR